jgi:hypothetical protein
LELQNGKSLSNVPKKDFWDLEFDFNPSFVVVVFESLNHQGKKHNNNKNKNCVLFHVFK